MDVSLARLISEIEKEKEDDYNFLGRFQEEDDDQFTNNINIDSFETYTTTTTTTTTTTAAAAAAAAFERSKEEEELLSGSTPTKLGCISPIQISFGELINSGPPLSTSPKNYRIISERNRRQKLGQNFISLAALIPGLKKMDKASILRGAIQYLKQSQESVKSLEERMDKNSQSQVAATEENNDYKKAGLEISARISGRHILINVHYRKCGGFEAMLLKEIARFGLVIVNTSFLSFGLNHVEATIITQMECDFNMSVEDLVTTLRSSVSCFVGGT